MPDFPAKKKSHFVIVDGYTGILDHLTDDPNEIRAMAGLGLPLGELPDIVSAAVTLLNWDDWYQAELSGNWLSQWTSYPAARPVGDLRPRKTDVRSALGTVRHIAIPAVNPGNGRPLTMGPDARAHGLLAENDPCFLASYILNDFLEQLHANEPIDAILFPQFGGLGYVAQMSRSTGAGLNGVAMGVVVTGASADRQAANGEGLWTRPAIIRRQMEDMSLGLADLAICFGPKGKARAVADGINRPVVTMPRRVDQNILAQMAATLDGPVPGGPLHVFLHEPMQGASGPLLALDAARLLHQRGRKLSQPLTCSGRNMLFPPNLPRDFLGYWSARGWAKEMAETGAWRWSEDSRPSPGTRGVRLYPGPFEHLPEIWSELAEGNAVLLSPEAAEGLAPGARFPETLVFSETPTPDMLADRLERLDTMAPGELEQARRDMCRAVLQAHAPSSRAAILEKARHPLNDMVQGKLTRPRLGDVAQRLLDRRTDTITPSITAIGGKIPATVTEPTLTVAVACYEMGDLITETVESIWASTRMPDELLLVDDGSRDPQTLTAIAKLEEKARSATLPFTLIRQGNLGLAGARNRALSEARCTHISFLDGDDLIEPDFYRLALDIMRDNPELGGVSAWSEIFGDDVPPGFWNPPQPELPLLLIENLVFVPVMSSVALLRDLGGYDTRQRYNYEDWELPIRMLAAGRPIVTIPRYLQRYRVRADSLLRTMSDVQNQVMREELFRNHRPLIEKFGPELAAQTEHRLMQSLARQKEAVSTAATSEVLQVLRHRISLRLAGSMGTWSRKTKNRSGKTPVQR